MAFAAQKFTDIDKSPYRAQILDITARGYISGSAGNAFKPDSSMTNADFVVAVVKALGLKPQTAASNSFADISKHWARTYINEAVRSGILIPSEYSKNLFNPNRAIKRSEAAAIMVRALKKQPDNSVVSFKDKANVEKSIYRGYIKTAYNLGLIPLAANGEFRPFNLVDRASACAMISQFLDAPKSASAAQTVPVTSTPVSSVTPAAPATLNGIVNVNISGQQFNPQTTPVSLLLGVTEVRIYSMAQSNSALIINGKYQFPLDKESGNPDFVISNTLYGVAKMTVQKNELFITPGYKKIYTFTLNGQKYHADFVNLYLNGAYGSLNLGQAEILSPTQVKIASTTYDLNSGAITIEIDNNCYILSSITQASNGEITPVLTATSSVLLRRSTVSDIATVQSGKTIISPNTITSLSFILDSVKYGQAEVIFDTAGNIAYGSKVYKASQVIAVINSTYYQINELKLYNGKISLYCTETNASMLVRVDSDYIDMSKVAIIKDGINYPLSNVVIVQKNVLRFSNIQTALSSAIKCKVNSKVYDITSVDFDTTQNCVVIVTKGEATGYYGSTQPTKYNFYVSGTLFQEGTTSSTAVLTGSTWTSFESINMYDASHFSVGSSYYDLMGAKVRINGTDYLVNDTVWRGKAQLYEIYMQKA